MGGRGNKLHGARCPKAPPHHIPPPVVVVVVVINDYHYNSQYAPTRRTLGTTEEADDGKMAREGCLPRHYLFLLCSMMMGWGMG